MELISINVGQPRDHLINDKLVHTGIVKAPVDGPVMMRELGMDGDGIGNTQSHGGRDQAVYAYAAEHYDAWAKDLGRDDLTYGMMGENLTVRGWVEQDVTIGDTYRIGQAVVMVTAFRNPCYKLDWHVGDTGFSKKYIQTGRYGMYLRVLQEGELCAGDAVELIEKSGSGLGVLELADLFIHRPGDIEAMRRAIGVDGLAERIRAKFEQRVEASK